MKDKLINIVLIMQIVITAIAIIPDKNHYNILKIWILLASGALLLILLLTNYKKLKLDKKDYAILGFGFLIFLSTIQANKPLIALLGEDNRYEGMLALYTYILGYMCAKKFLNFKKKTILRIMQILYIAICTWGIIQNYVLYPTSRLIPILNKGVCGTFGNTNFMGNFASMGLPLFIITYILNNDKVSLINTLTTFFCLLACNARSGWVAFIAFGIVLIIYLERNFKKEYIKRILILIFAFTIIFTMLYTQKHSFLKMKINTAKYDIAMMKESGMASGKLGSGRIAIWRIVIDVIREIPNSRCWARQLKVWNI